MAALLSDKLPFWPDMSSTELAYLHIQDLLGVQHTYRIKKIGRERDCNNKDRKIKQKNEERQRQIIQNIKDRRRKQKNEDRQREIITSKIEGENKRTKKGKERS